MTTKTKPPAHLGATGKTLWQRLHDGHAIDDPAGLALLQSLCESADRLAEARDILARDGLVISDRYGTPKAHPAAALERDARGQMHSAMRLLRLSPGDVA